MNITVDTLRALIERTHEDKTRKGKAFSVTFVKANGEERTMRARLGMRRNLTGKGLKYDPIEKRLVTVWELGNGYRHIPLDRLVSLRLPDAHKHLKETLKPGTQVTLFA